MTTITQFNVERAPYTQVGLHLRNYPKSRDWSNLGEVIRLLQYDGQCDASLDEPMFRRLRVHAGHPVFSMGQEFSGLYLVRRGCLKTVVNHSEGSEHVIAFSMQGDLLGAEGISQHAYWCESYALSNCEVIRLPADDYFMSGRNVNGIERMLYWAISREVGKRQSANAVTHAAKSVVRVARFLVELSERHAALGYSPKYFTLHMTRRDIGSYLSLTLETVSRALSSLHQLKIIEVCSREIVIHSLEALQAYEG
jgi:CRP/FNR family transcriptional regulator